ncbi:4432_t:CDS:2 [Funneliformis geosporum]|uniref:4432_t:CDS:1 n=1 Tax=Funneliformis geosporum TaxID=1117311 RepID=A0A9W4WP12_9GLOM|nr:4432_t:CDS:2 [Funneliformis geosporum]
MLYLLVQVNESIKCVISERIVSIESTVNKFCDLFNAVIAEQYNNREVQVFVRREKSESWREVDNGLNSDLKILEVFGFLQQTFISSMSN